MNAKELKSLLENCQNADHWPDIARSICGGSGEPRRYEIKEGKLVKELNELGYRLFHEDGYGGEGMGDEYWGVFSVEKRESLVSDPHTDITFFEIRGWYASFNGAEVEAWDFYKVEKVQVQKYEWHQVK